MTIQTNDRTRDIPLLASNTLSILHPRLAAQMEEYRFRLSVYGAGYPVLTDWHPVIPDGWGEFPSVPVDRAVIYRGNSDSWAYSHHQGITKFGDKYVVSWSNGLLHEDYLGQEPHYSWSHDGLHWAEPKVLVHTPVESGLVRSNAGIYVADGLLYNYVCVARDYGRDVSPPGMYSYKKQRVPMDVYVTADLENWEHHPNICDNILLMEGPRPTQDGTLMCCGLDMTEMSAVILIWRDSSQLAGPPQVVPIPASQGVTPEEGTWYQTDDGRIWMYQRDYANSCRLGLTYSDDGGTTWSDLLRTDFPNTISRAYAGRLSDGRFYIVGNNYDLLLDRRRLLIALSDDGYVFDRQYTLAESDATRRVNGRHKEDGYQYPSCFADGDKLLVVYSANKEDIEIAILDTKDLV